MAPSQPWLIVAAFPTHHPRTIGRTRNRSDAEAMVRFLQRKVPGGVFSVVFEEEGEGERGRGGVTEQGGGGVTEQGRGGERGFWGILGGVELGMESGDGGDSGAS